MNLFNAFQNFKHREPESFDFSRTLQFKARYDMVANTPLSLVCGAHILHAGIGLIDDGCFAFANADNVAELHALVGVSLSLSPTILAKLARQCRRTDPVAVFSGESPYPLASFAQDMIPGNFVTPHYLDYLAGKVGRNHWWLDACFAADDNLYALGWAVPPVGWQGGLPEIRIDGLRARVETAISTWSSDTYWFLAGDERLGFCAHAPIRSVENFTRISLSFGAMDHEQAVRRFDLYQITNWPETFDIPVPPEENIHRVSGPLSNRYSFINGGKTDFERFRTLIGETLGRTDLKGLSVLDWGVGCGRLSRYFLQEGANVTGADIDRGNITWCRENMSPGLFEVVDLMPPTQLPENNYDVIISSSVLSHLTEEAMHAWLKEMNRVLKPDGVALLSFNGSGNAYLYGAFHKPAIETLDSYGFFDEWRTPDLDGAVDGAENYYRFTIMSDYRAKEIFSANGKLERIVPGVTSMHQDMAVLRKL